MTIMKRLFFSFNSEEIYEYEVEIRTTILLYTDK